VARTSKFLLVTGGYAAALVVAWLVAQLRLLAAGGQATAASPGMSAFGDLVLFLGVFGVASLPATGATLFFLRTRPGFWSAASIAALCIASTSVAALVLVLLPHATRDHGTIGIWSSLSPLRILVAPFSASVCFLAFLFAPTRSSRPAFLIAALVESIAFIWAVLTWSHSG
jgi:hypothetical protein